MADNKIKVRHVQRHDTESNWSSKDPVLLDGELAFTTDGTNTGKYKLGNGTSKWSALSYAKARLEKDDVTTALGYTPSATDHKHTKSDITDFPSSLPANGGTSNYTNYLNVHTISANTNLNNYTTPGYYCCKTNDATKTLTNSPTTNAFFMIVGTHAGTYQELTEYMSGTPKKYIRNLYNGTWGSWNRIYTTIDNPTKSDVGLGNVDNTADKDKSVKSATVANTLSGYEGTADANRHVWFSSTTDETRRNYTDSFMYNPNTQMLTTNISGKSASATKLNSSRTIALGTGASGSVSFDGSQNVTIPVTNIKESYLSWGGRNISGSYSCIDAAMIPDLGANRLAFGKSAGITVEYSRDAGETWTDYGLSNYYKTALFGNGGIVAIGNADSTNKATADYMARITIDTDTFGIYTVLNKFAIYISTNGSTGTYCSIDASLESTPTTWVNFADKVSISGWSGWNIINVSGLTTYGNSKTVQYGLIRFTFGCTGGSDKYSGMQIYRIMGFGGFGWSTPSNMAKYGTIYTYDNNQNVAFPAGVTATSFSGNASTATALTTNAGNATQPVYFSGGKPVATTYTLGKSVPSDAVFTDTKYTLPTASSSTLGGVKTTSTVTSTSGYTACPIISGVPYYKNTTYSVASTSANGLMSSSDKTKLNGMTLMSVTDFEALFK